MTKKDVLLVISPTQADRFNGIAQFAKGHGWNIMIEKDIPTSSIGWQGDGAIVMLKDNPTLIRFVRRLLSRHVPVVDLILSRPDIHLPRVCGDSESMGRLAAAHFEEHAFRNLAFFASNWSPVHALRYKGFCPSNGDRPRPARWIWRENAKKQQYNNWKAFENWLSPLLTTATKPLGIFCYSDYDAMRVANVCRLLGLSIPDEVAILGVDDNTLICENQPVPLSSVQHSLFDIGYRGAEMLHRLMTETKPYKESCPQILIPPKGISVRRSTDTIATGNPIFRKALSYIAQHLSEAFGCAEIAAAIDIPRVRLDRLFAAELGRSAGKEILRQRLLRAKTMLRESDAPLETIATACGFCHAAHLSNTFRHRIGITPGAYRTSCIR